MSKDRVLGSSAMIAVYSKNGPIPVGEIDKFEAQEELEQLTHQPLGQVGEEKQLVYKGWKFTCSGGKVDHALADLFAAQDAELLQGKPASRYLITQTIRHYDGYEEIWKYPDALLFGFKQSAGAAKEEMKEDFEGWARLRIPG